MWKHEVPLPTASSRRRDGVGRWVLSGALAMGGFVAASVAAIASPEPASVESGVVDLRAVPDSILARPRVVVLEVDRGEFDDLRANPGRRGRRWERAGRVAFLSNGQLTFESPVGIRVHGGSSRYLPAKSLRLFFRPSLGATRPVSREVGLEGESRYETLVLHGDVRPDTGGLQFRFINPLSYRIASRLGIPTSATVPVSLVINGAAPQTYVTSEHLNHAFLKRRFGSDSVRSYDMRDDVDRERLRTQGPLAELRARFGPPEGWTMEQVGEVVDLDNLSNWLLSVLFCGTRDLYQGTLVHDPSRPGPKWFWMGWDYDMSFGRLDGQYGSSDALHMNWLFGDAPGQSAEPRSLILKHLFATSEPFRRDFARRFVRARDSLVTAEFIDQTLSEFERAAAEHGVTDVRYQALVRTFLERRPAILTQQLRTHLSADLP